MAPPALLNTHGWSRSSRSGYLFSMASANASNIAGFGLPRQARAHSWTTSGSKMCAISSPPGGTRFARHRLIVAHMLTTLDMPFAGTEIGVPAVDPISEDGRHGEVRSPTPDRR